VGNAHSHLNPSAQRASTSLSVLVIAPLPFRQNGATAFSYGGSIFFSELLPRLARLGHRVRVVAEAPGEDRAAARQGLDCETPNLRVEWFALEYRTAATPPPPSFVAAQRQRLQPLLDRLVRDERPDVVVLGRETLAWYVPDRCRQHALPSLLIAHGSPTAALRHGIYPEADAAQLIEHLHEVDYIVAVARHVEDALRSFGITRIRTITNVADPTRFRPAPKDPSLLRALEIEPDQPVIGHLTNLRPGKRPLDLVASAAIVLQAHPRAIYLVIGDGPLRGEMEDACRAARLRTSFRFVGEIDHGLIPTYLNLVDLVVFTSEREGFPFTFREVQACGRVLLAGDIPPAREAIIDRETGLLFRLGDIDELAATTTQVLRDSGLRERIGRQARAAVEAERPDDWAAAYAEVLRDVATAQRAAP
jgi:glycosyltransferase involved in cell wall biosynthesis